MKKKDTRNAQMNWRPLPEDKKLMAELSAELGVSESDVIRLGLRCLRQANKDARSESKAAD